MRISLFLFIVFAVLSQPNAFSNTAVDDPSKALITEVLQNIKNGNEKAIVYNSNDWYINTLRHKRSVFPLASNPSAKTETQPSKKIISKSNNRNSTNSDSKKGVRMKITGTNKNRADISSKQFSSANFYQQSNDNSPQAELISSKNRLFTPNEDGYNDEVTIKLRAKNGNNHKFTLRIFDLSGYLILSRDNPDVISEADGWTSYAFVWWGYEKDDVKVCAKMGMYIYTIDADDRINWINDNNFGTITLITNKWKGNDHDQGSFMGN